MFYEVDRVVDYCTQGKVHRESVVHLRRKTTAPQPLRVLGENVDMEDNFPGVSIDSK